MTKEHIASWWKTSKTGDRPVYGFGLRKTTDGITTALVVGFLEDGPPVAVEVALEEVETLGGRAAPRGSQGSARPRPEERLSPTGDIDRDLEVLLRLALVSKAGGRVRLGYAKTHGAAAEVRRLEDLALRGEVVVAADLDRDAARSFRIDRIAWVEREPGGPWLLFDEERGGYAQAPA